MKTFTVLTLLTLTLACGQDPQTSGGLVSEARDSAGILIVENARPPEGSRLGWRIGPEPDVSIGVLEGEEPYMFDWVADATILPDGRIVVADGGTQEVRVFDRDGRHLTTWGGEGGGPREFTSLFGVGRWPGDSIAAWYAGNLGVSIFNSEGVFARSFFLQSEPSVYWLRPRPEAVRQDGFIMSRRELEEDRGVVVEMWDGEGLLSASLGQHPDEEIIYTTDSRGNRASAEIAYGRRLVTGLWGDLVVISPTSRYEIRAHRADGTPERLVRREHVPRVPTEADRDPYVEDQMVRILGGNVPEPLAVEFRRVFGSVETPEGLEILEIGEDYILGKTEDEFELEYVQVWPLERVEG